MSSETSSSGGVGVSTVLLVVFIVLKLTGNISWPWLWVLSPLWISVCLAVVIGLCFMIVGPHRKSRTETTAEKMREERDAWVNRGGR